ncbi:MULTISPECIES: NAD(P)/FAD-dependent oxidoreductase [Robiginitalea]|mgnify:CR=1 FL=1|uniref:NAD(P)/FAD-dependent oxidoreductase n=1 Tax=Robiginitalea TaxID=252306 RepID=UPI00234B8E54|nr:MULTISPECIES: NAD(P)/FAD-dependent oxidoreductase [unclassified Robiginitalea]MDC6354535.1 NAD(P)/FAD-dependent oxidoreductase [Robiginitalea sp. PM2]MDC6374783.1 NAD(P)/FAD-dependent oxidoreductase [Robiginitalea sp. SP8]
MIQTDILIIGAGPTGLFTVFEAGLLQLKCHLIDALPQPGGQCAEIYPKKPIYDIPAYPEILAGDLVDRLMEQIRPFNPGFTLGERAETLEKQEDGQFVVTTNRGTRHKAPVVVIAGGLGSFEPRKPQIDNLADFEDRGVSYMVRDPEVFRDKKVVIAGGGDSALDWSIYLADVAAEVSLVHRRNEFRGALDSVEKASALAAAGKIRLYTEAQVTRLYGDAHLEAVVVSYNDQERGESYVEADHFIPLFGLSPKLGPIGDWGLEIERNAIKVNNAYDYQTNIPGVYAIGDVNTYPGKLKLILSGFHEAAVMCQSAYQVVNPGKRYVMKYTTVGGVTGFDGSKKEAKKEVIQAIA